MSFLARLTRKALIAAVALAPVGCRAYAIATDDQVAQNGPNGIQAGSVQVTPTATGLTVKNQTERPVYLFAVNAEMLALLDWAPCTGGSKCPALAQGASREIPWSDVTGYQANVKQYTVYCWNVTVQPDGTPRADNMHNLTVSR